MAVLVCLLAKPSLAGCNGLEYGLSTEVLAVFWVMSWGSIAIRKWVFSAYLWFHFNSLNEIMLVEQVFLWWCSVYWRCCDSLIFIYSNMQSPTWNGCFCGRRGVSLTMLLLRVKQFGWDGREVGLASWYLTKWWNRTCRLWNGIMLAVDSNENVSSIFQS